MNKNECMEYSPEYGCQWGRKCKCDKASSSDVKADANKVVAEYEPALKAMAASSGNGELLYTEQDVKNAYKAGWIASSEWAKRDDLVLDIGSPAYLDNRKRLIHL